MKKVSEICLILIILISKIYQQEKHEKLNNES